MGAPSAATSTLVAGSSAVVADGTQTLPLTLTLEDAVGNPVPLIGVSFSSSAPQDHLSPANANTNTNSTGTVATSMTPTAVGAKSVLATVAGGLTLVASPAPTFIAGPPTAANSTLVASPNTQVADGNTVSTLSVVLRDQFNNPAIPQAVSLSVSGMLRLGETNCQRH